MAQPFVVLTGVRLSFVGWLLLASACGDDGRSQGTTPPPSGGCVAGFALAPALGDARFDSPVEIVPGPGGRFYVLEQAGVVRAVPRSGGAMTTVLDLGTTIGSLGSGESGLLGIAFDPAFATSGHVYLHFTAPRNPPQTGVVFQSVVARFTSQDSGATFDPTSEKRILVVDQPYANHNGGKIAFGPDGMLYVGLGDGGSGGDPHRNGQNTNTLLGKILRIDPRSGDPYAIPAGNPFGAGGGRPEIFAYGLRNPWKFAFDRKNGELWAGDVGQGAYEEVDKITAGGNYGWNVREGAHCYDSASCSTEGLVDPIAEYGRDEGYSVTGGYVYRGSALPALDGRYVYGDFGTGRIWSVSSAGDVASVLDSDARISTFAEDEAGEIYVADYVSGRVEQLVAACR